LMGGNRGDYGLRDPVATAVESATPTLRWNAVEGAENYTVAIYDTGSKKVLTSGPVLKHSWKASSALERGRTYSWQVRAIKDGREILMPPPAAPDAKFRIIEQNKLHEIQLARKSHANSYLVLGVVYAEAGMLDESERELQKLVVANLEVNRSPNRPALGASKRLVFLDHKKNVQPPVGIHRHSLQPF